MTTEAIKDQIVKLSRKEQAEIVHFIMNIFVAEDDFELTPEIKSEIDASYEAVESGRDKGLTHEAYRKEMKRFLSDSDKDRS